MSSPLVNTIKYQNEFSETDNLECDFNGLWQNKLKSKSKLSVSENSFWYLKLNYAYA